MDFIAESGNDDESLIDQMKCTIQIKKVLFAFSGNS